MLVRLHGGDGIVGEGDPAIHPVSLSDPMYLAVRGNSRESLDQAVAMADLAALRRRVVLSPV